MEYYQTLQTSNVKQSCENKSKIHYTEEATQMTIKCIKSCWAPLAVRKTQIEITMDYHGTSIRTTKTNNIKVMSANPGKNKQTWTSPVLLVPT